MLGQTESPESVKSSPWGTKLSVQNVLCFVQTVYTIIKLELPVLELWSCRASLAWLKKKISMFLRQLLCANEELTI